LIAFDSYQRLDAVRYDPRLPVKVVDIDEESLGRIGQWPWPRTVIADLLARLRDQGAAVVAFDVLFSEPDRTSPEAVLPLLPEEVREALAALVAGRPTHDAQLAATMASVPTVLGVAGSDRATPPPPVKAGFAFAGDDPRAFITGFLGATSNLPAFDTAAAGIGSVNWIPDRDQVIRRIPLIYRVGDEFLPALASEALRVAQGASTYLLKASNASGETAFGAASGLNHIRIGDFEIPTDAEGGIWLRFRPYTRDAYVPAWQVLAGENRRDDIDGRIILVGASAPGLFDIRATPLNAGVPGVELHAQVIEQIVSGAAARRMLSRPDYATGLEIVLTVTLGLVLAFIFTRIRAIYAAIVGIGVIGSLVASAWVAYTRVGILVDPTWPAVTLFLLVAAATTYVYRRSEQQRSEVRRAFSYYVSPTVVNEIIAHPEKLELGGVVREVTLLFCDVRNFSTISERMTAHELTRFINSLLTPLSEIILENRGTIDKYIGDEIMAFWNAPLDDPDHAKNALGSALAMVARMSDLNKEWRRQAEAEGRSHVEVRIGIGINSGDVCVGNLGSLQRFDYSAIGDNVNVASRIEGLSKVYGVPLVVGEATMQRLGGVPAVELDVLRVKGRAQPTRVFTPLAAIGFNGGSAALVDRHNAMLKAYRRRDWPGAEGAIVACQEFGVVGLAELYRLYRARIAEWRANPPPDDWDGTYTATSK
jgi:adenylate cyclase